MKTYHGREIGTWKEFIITCIVGCLSMGIGISFFMLLNGNHSRNWGNNGGFALLLSCISCVLMNVKNSIFINIWGYVLFSLSFSIFVYSVYHFYEITQNEDLNYDFYE